MNKPDTLMQDTSSRSIHAHMCLRNIEHSLLSFVSCLNALYRGQIKRRRNLTYTLCTHLANSAFVPELKVYVLP